MTTFLLTLATTLASHAMQQRANPKELALTCAKQNEGHCDGMLATAIGAWLHRSNITNDEIVNVLKSRGMSTQEIDLFKKEPRYEHCCAYLDDNKYDISFKTTPSLGICKALFYLFKNAQPKHHEAALQCGSITPHQKLLDFLKDKENFAILSLFMTYEKYGGKGYGPVFWEKIMDFLRREYPDITTLILFASPLFMCSNALSTEKLYEFYEKLGAQQIDPRLPSYFYYDLTKKRK